MEKLELDVFGLKINVNPRGELTNVYVFNSTTCTLEVKSQDGRMYHKPINTVEEFSKTPEEFVNEFKNQNAIKIHEFINNKQK